MRVHGVILLVAEQVPTLLIIHHDSAVNGIQRLAQRQVLPPQRLDLRTQQVSLGKPRVALLRRLVGSPEASFRRSASMWFIVWPDLECMVAWLVC